MYTVLLKTVITVTNCEATPEQTRYIGIKTPSGGLICLAFGKSDDDEFLESYYAIGPVSVVDFFLYHQKLPLDTKLTDVPGYVSHKVSDSSLTLWTEIGTVESIPDEYTYY